MAKEPNQVSIVVSSSSGTVNVLAGLAIIILIGIAAYWLLVQVLIPLIGNILLILLAVFSAFMFKSKKPMYDESRPWVAVAAENWRKEGHTGTDKQYYQMMLATLAVVLILYVLATVTVIAYAVDPHYQQVPINWLGFLTVAAMVAITCVMFQFLALFPKFQTEPMRKPPVYRSIIGKTASILGVAYPLVIFLTKFGIL